MALTDHDRPGPLLPDLSPEARRKEALRHKAGLSAQMAYHVGPGSRAYGVAKRVVVGAWNDGFIHAGNLAYMTILAIFPFFITGAALFSLFGEAREQNAAIVAVLLALPPEVGEVIEPVARAAVASRSGWLLWVGGVVGLWTVGSLIETIRDILRRAYGTRPTQAFWWYRLLSSGLIVATGVGATGWLKAVAAMLTGLGADRRRHRLVDLPDPTGSELVFVVREPFPSPTTGTDIVCGRIRPDRPLVVHSNMPRGGAVFSDGVVEKAVDWNAGSRVVLTVGDRYVNRLVP